MKVVNISILKDKMKFQDFPMLAIMIIQFFASFGEGTKSIEMIVSLIQIACTFLSIMSAWISLKWNKNVKGIDLNLIQNKLIERKNQIENPNKKKEQKNKDESQRSEADNSMSKKGDTSKQSNKTKRSQ